jgi:hypothetical protein
MCHGFCGLDLMNKFIITVFPRKAAISNDEKRIKKEKEIQH